MTKQEYYELLVNSALNDTFPCIAYVHGEWGFKTRFAFRSVTGNKVHKCPIGLLIPDEEYVPDLENRRVFQLPPYLRVKIAPEGMTLEDLDVIQQIHDEVGKWSRWQPDRFISQINHLHCFDDCKKRVVQ